MPNKEEGQSISEPRRHEGLDTTTNTEYNLINTPTYTPSIVEHILNISTNLKIPFSRERLIGRRHHIAPSSEISSREVIFSCSAMNFVWITRSSKQNCRIRSNDDEDWRWENVGSDAKMSKKKYRMCGSCWYPGWMGQDLLLVNVADARCIDALCSDPRFWRIVVRS